MIKIKNWKCKMIIYNENKMAVIFRCIDQFHIKNTLGFALIEIKYKLYLHWYKKSYHSCTYV